ncbi:hypothetical protein DBV15_12452, partial [Temnothorax longispinosus]
MIVHLTAAGLIYCHFGRDVLRNVLSDVTEDRELIIYAKLIRDIDARDNGPQMYSSPCTLRALIYELNFLLSDSRDEEKDQQFKKAVARAQKFFLEFVQVVRNIHLPSMDIVRHTIESRFKVRKIFPLYIFSFWVYFRLSFNVKHSCKVYSSGEIIILSKFVPYEEYLFEVEKEMNVVRSINVGGLSNDTLVRACGIEGALHVHSNRHTGIHQTEEGAIIMAWRALELDNLPKVIGRYVGPYYCSEVLAIVLLKLLPEYKNASIMQREFRHLVFDESNVIVGDTRNIRECDVSRYGYTMATST